MSESPANAKPQQDPLLFEMTGIEAHVDWERVFGNPNPVELEVGSGKGLFLQNAATTNPSRNYFGIELSRKYATKAAERLWKRGLTNAKVWSGDGKLFLSKHVPPGSLRAVHVYFPDPWWKARHKKRRVFNETLVADIELALTHEGELHIATDVEEYFYLMKDLVAAHFRFEPVTVEDLKPPEHELDYLTNFERKYRIEGRPIYRASYRFR